MRSSRRWCGPAERGGSVTLPGLAASTGLAATTGLFMSTGTSIGIDSAHLTNGDYSACRGDPDVAAGQFGEDVEGPAAVLGRGGQVGAHRGVVLGAGEG